MYGLIIYLLFTAAVALVLSLLCTKAQVAKAQLLLLLLGSLLLHSEAVPARTCAPFQATEPSTLVPLMRGARQVALVGDHKQLPPTIISREAELAGLNVSLFDRLVAAGVQPFLLDTQVGKPLLC
eukprot:scaffold305896_cov16-Prasinocladus_malaysianus.AAC.1